MFPKEKILLTLSLALFTSIVLTLLAIAYAGGLRGPGLIGACFLMTFGITVVLGQWIPAAILMSSLIGMAFSSREKIEIPI